VSGGIRRRARPTISMQPGPSRSQEEQSATRNLRCIATIPAPELRALLGKRTLSDFLENTQDVIYFKCHRQVNWAEGSKRAGDGAPIA